ncbi:Hint domain-containing protein [Acetobacter oryzifermentans]|uniref:Hint domain-containing protein n=1 Tax=Acetobacter oryzifermentans TaxID=1633874 RepID=UPI0039BF96E5
MSDSNTIEITLPDQDVSLSGASAMTGSNYYKISNPSDYHFTLDLSITTSDLYATYDPTNKETIISTDLNAGSGYTNQNLYVVIPDTATVSNPLNITHSLSGAYQVTNITTDGTYSDTFACFLKDSFIKTENGYVPVQDIVPGRMISVFMDGKEEQKEVVWAGTARVVVNGNLPEDQAGYPVRVLKNSISENVPFKDMLITSEHCLFVEGKFVPARMLVNGRSIYYDTSVTSYNYYHIETEKHSVIMADGMLTESYLDTGNRRNFQSAGKVIRIGGKQKNWQQDAAAPLGVQREFVEPIFQKIEERAKNLGIENRAEPKVLIEYPDIKLITNAGATIYPFKKSENTYSFMLPAGVESVRVVSRSSRPCDFIGPFVDDRRQMGVAVGKIHFGSIRASQQVTEHLAASKPEGWHDMGWQDCAWTDGNALLPLLNIATNKMGILSLEIRASGPYVVCVDQQEDVALSA